MFVFISLQQPKYQNNFHNAYVVWYESTSKKRSSDDVYTCSWCSDNSDLLMDKQVCSIDLQWVFFTIPDS